MTSLDHLMPALDDSIRCADHARQIAVDPGGTAIRADRVVLVETSLPWPKPVFDHLRLREIGPVFKEAAQPTRLLACQPESATDGTHVWVFDRLARNTRERRFSVTSPDELRDLCSRLAAEAGGEEPTSPTVAAPTFDGVMSEPTVLVCTQGSHDICCGSDGARFAIAVEAITAEDSSVRCFRVSHTGGHRFAPTAMTLPDGRMWAYLVPELLSEILSGRGHSEKLAPYCRGWWGAERGPEQMAERAVFATVGFALDTMGRSITEIGPSTYQVRVAGSSQVESRRWTVDVELGREVPGIACRQPGGLPAKPGNEYRATIRPEA